MLKKLADPNIEWRPVIGAENYSISNNGVVYNARTKRYSIGDYSERYACIDIRGVYSGPLHRLLWVSFNGPILEGMVIDHIDGDTTNNCLSNLRCASQSENAYNAQAHGHKGQHPVAKMDKNGNILEVYPSFTIAGQTHGVTYAAISAAAKRNGTSCGYYWKELIEEEVKELKLDN